jgi:hypothetical protein
MLMFRKRPFCYLEPFPTPHPIEPQTGRLRLRIVNPGDHPIQISSLTRWGRNSTFSIMKLAPPQFVHAEQGAAERWFFFSQRGIFRDFIEAKDTRYYGIFELEEEHRAILVFWWHRNGFLRVRVPMCVVLSSKRMATIANVPPHVPI